MRAVNTQAVFKKGGGTKKAAAPAKKKSFSFTSGKPQVSTRGPRAARRGAARRPAADHE